MTTVDDVIRECGDTIDDVAHEVIRLRSQLADAERERDEARRERYRLLTNAKAGDDLLAQTHYERDQFASMLHDCENERDGWKHRAERAERVVERINGIRLSPLCCDGENNAEVDAYHDGFNAAMEEVRDAIRALDAEAQP